MFKFLDQDFMIHGIKRFSEVQKYPTGKLSTIYNFSNFFGYTKFSVILPSIRLLIWFSESCEKGTIFFTIPWFLIIL